MKACRLSRLHTRFTKAPPAQCWERLYQMVPLYEKSRRHSHLSGLSAANHIISSHADGAMTHAARCSQCGQCRRQNGYNHLYHRLPCLFLHNYSFSNFLDFFGFLISFLGISLT